MATGQHVDPEQATAIAGAGGQAAGDAAQAGKTSAEAQAATEAAMQAEAQRQGVTLTDKDVERIAEGTIAMLEARGAFDQAPSSTPPSSEPAAPSSGNANEPSAASTPEPSPSTASTSSPSGDEQPRKRTFAERFQGKA